MNNFFPSEDETEQVHHIRDLIIDDVKVSLEKYGVVAEVMAVGSTAKDTFVKGDMDIDIFIVSPQYKQAYNLLSKDFSQGRRKVGPMDIWHFLYKAYDIDLVCIPPNHPRIDTLTHTSFMNRHLSQNQKKEVIRAKAFFKSKGVYGAEIGGIVGIAIEELIREYNTLNTVCRVLSSGERPPFVEDPANPKRTLLASIKKARWQQIKEACTDYLNRQTFTYRDYTPLQYLSERTDWRHLFFERQSDRATDFHTALSTCNHVLHLIKGREKEVKGTCDAYVWQNTVVSYHVTPRTLSRTKTHCGPPLTMKNAVDVFKSVHKDTFERNGRVCTVITREETDVVDWMNREITSRMQNRGYTRYIP